ncbi:hypothetical protein KYY02_25200 [Streptomyces pimonensis]|uniref:Uncharacterized protein n=1 Tax=Streptomyces pimonensis TaxID=2860288 RepID=A0ABV4J4J3_9ACTN
MDTPIQLERASDAVRGRVQDSFERQGPMAHLGARLPRIGPGRVHIVLPARPEVRRQHGCIRAGADGYATLIPFGEDSEILTVEFRISQCCQEVNCQPRLRPGPPRARTYRSGSARSAPPAGRAPCARAGRGKGRIRSW